MLLLDKPSGPTSHDIIDRVRRAVKVRRVGHAGTLDPFASGLLVVLVGRATRLAQFLSGFPKYYRGRIRLGVTTDTADPTGTVIRSSDGWRELSTFHIAAAMTSLTGRYLQQPPAYSAKKTGGERAYRLARRGESVELAPAEVEVTRFDLLKHDGAELSFEAEVRSGTYIRALARDLGEGLSCGAHLETLQRTRVGPFSVEDAATLAELEAGSAPLRPSSEAVAHLTRVQVGEAERQAIQHGRAVPADTASSGPVAVFADGVLVAIAERRGDTLRPRVVLTDA